MAVFGGLGIGPVISETVIGEDRFDAALWVAVGFALLAAALAMLTPKGVRHHDLSDQSGPRFNRAAIPPGLVLAFGVGGFVTFNAFMPDYSVTVGLDGSKWVFATYAGVCLLIRVVGATIPDRIGHARAVTIALTLMATGLAMLYLWPHPLGVFTSTVIVGIGISFNYPGLMAMTVESVPARTSSHLDVHDVLRDRNGDGAVLFGILADLTSKRAAPWAGRRTASSGWSSCGRLRSRDRGHTWLSDFR